MRVKLGAAARKTLQIQKKTATLHMSNLDAYQMDFACELTCHTLVHSGRMNQISTSSGALPRRQYK